MATAPLQTFGRGPTFLDWDGKPVETQQFGSPRGGARGPNMKRLNHDVAARQDDVFSAVPPPEVDEEDSTGIFNPTIGAPSPAVQAALAIPAGQRSLAQKKLLTDRQGTEAMSADRGGTVKNGVTQALADEQNVAKAGAQGRFDSQMADSYTSGVNGTSTNVPGSTERAQSQYMPKNPTAPLANNSLAAPKPTGYASRTMDDGTVRTASGFKDGHPNVSNIQTFSDEAAATAAFRPGAAPTGPSAYSGSLTPPDPRGDPTFSAAPASARGAGLPSAQGAMMAPAVARPPASPLTTSNGSPIMPLPAPAISPVSATPMTPPMDDPRNPANNRAATLSSTMPTASARPSRPGGRPVTPFDSQIASAASAVKEAVASPIRTAARTLAGDSLSQPTVQNPFLAKRTTAPTTQFKMNAKTLGQPRNSGMQSMGADLDPFRRF